MLLALTNAFSQEANSVSDHFTIEGKVNNKISFDFARAADYASVSLDSFVIYNHLHEKKRTVKNIRGILLTDILKKSGIDEKSPRLFSEFYFTCIAADGYKVVFSWNEIFNTEIGGQILVVTEADGMKQAAMPDRILLLSARDIATGRRYVKGLEKIIVDRVK
jgi:hypothetical protein